MKIDLFAGWGSALQSAQSADVAMVIPAQQQPEINATERDSVPSKGKRISCASVIDDTGEIECHTLDLDSVVTVGEW